MNGLRNANWPVPHIFASFSLGKRRRVSRVSGGFFVLNSLGWMGGGGHGAGAGAR